MINDLRMHNGNFWTFLGMTLWLFSCQSPVQDISLPFAADAFHLDTVFYRTVPLDNWPFRLSGIENAQLLDSVLFFQGRGQNHKGENDGFIMTWKYHESDSPNKVFFSQRIPNYRRSFYNFSVNSNELLTFGSAMMCQFNSDLTYQRCWEWTSPPEIGITAHPFLMIPKQESTEEGMRFLLQIRNPNDKLNQLGKHKGSAGAFIITDTEANVHNIFGEYPASFYEPGPIFTVYGRMSAGAVSDSHIYTYFLGNRHILRYTFEGDLNANIALPASDAFRENLIHLEPNDPIITDPYSLLDQRERIRQVSNDFITGFQIHENILHHVEVKCARTYPNTFTTNYRVLDLDTGAFSEFVLAAQDSSFYRLLDITASGEVLFSKQNKSESLELLQLKINPVSE